MREFKKALALVCVMAVLFSILLVGCKDPDGPSGGTGSSSDTTPSSGATDSTGSGSSDSNGSYTVTVSSMGGTPIADATIFIYSDESLSDLVSYGVTNAEGKATIDLEPSDSYRIVISGAPDGYVPEESYPFVGKNADIVLYSQVISDPNLSGVQYKLGSVMHDFTITDSDGNSHTLSELLKEKDMVMLNFWYTSCSYCVEEFPYMNAAYEQYKDEIEILALNHYSADDEDAVKLFKSSMSLSFPMAKEELGMQTAFNLQGYPTSVFIDRYGVICLIEVGGVPSETPFLKAFEHFTAEDYQQKLFANIGELTPTQTPTAEMPSSEEMGAVFNKGDISVSYAPETEGEDAEMSWPFIIGEKDGVSCVYPANIGADGSYATLYAYVDMKAGEALAFDYLASSESGMDVLFVLIDRKDIYQISGQSSAWNTCYPFVALEDGQYELAFCFLKDESDAAGDDTVYLKDLRVIPQEQVDVPTYIPRYCANNLNDDGFGYQDYVSVVYNEADGYYHVGTANGPLLLANLTGTSRFSNDSIYSLAAAGQIVIDGVDYYDALLPYCTMASNSELYGFCTVNQELMELLKKVTQAVGIEQSENEWLQICSYYDVYGTNGVQLADPVRGLSAETALKAEMGKENVVTYNRVIMPRGLLYKFVPTTSGVYRITSHSQEYEVDGWVFLAENLHDRSEFYVYEANERMYYDPLNVSMVLYLEAGVEYYIDIAFYDIYQTGTFTFTIDYVAPTLNHFVVASPGYFTYYDEDTYAVEAGGINIALGDDGYYHELRADGSLGSVLYADFIGSTGVFSTSLMQMLDTPSFDFTLTESDQYVLTCIDSFETDDYEAEFRALWGDAYEEYMEFYQVEDVLAGIYHGNGKDMTDIACKYAAMIAGPSGAHPEMEGCVAVNQELADLLQELMDKFTFEGVEYSWKKLCFYYDYLGPK